MKYIQSLSLLGVLLLFLSFSAYAQKSAYTIKGKVVDGEQLPIAFATVVVHDAANDEILDGTSSDVDGLFSVPSNKADVYVVVSFVGHESQTIRELSFNNRVVDLGVVSLSMQAEFIDAVTVRAEKSYTVFLADRRVFNVGQDLSSTGASAMEVLDNVPSVNVNVEGEISLRGNTGVQVLINGKPSVLAGDDGNALGSITADMIERVEVITNPGAEYEAEGTSGIINIIIKKDERKGINGSISLNTGWPHNHSVGLSMNRRSERINLFTQLGAGYRSLPRFRENINHDLVADVMILSEGEEYRDEQFVNALLGADFYIDSSRVLTVSGKFAYEWEDQPSTYDFIQQVNGLPDAAWQRTENTTAGNPKFNYELQYKRDLGADDHFFRLSALGNYFQKEQSSLFNDSYSLGNQADAQQRTATNFGESKYTFNADYSKPMGLNWVLTAGGQAVVHDVGNAYSVEELQDGAWLLDSTQSNDFSYAQNVVGVYGTAAFEQAKWSAKAGLRVEYTDLNTLLEQTQESNQQEYLNPFPSAHVSYKFTERTSFQAGYSRRVQRPRMWSLNPFFNLRNNFAVRTGNPALQPEYSNSYEVNSIFLFNKASFNLGVFHLYTTDVIERVSVFENNVNTVRPENIGTNSAWGSELNFKYGPLKWLSLNGDVNWNYYQRKGQLNDQVFDFNAHRWEGKISSKYKLPKAFEAEWTHRYESAHQTAQYQVKSSYSSDIGLRKKLNKGKAVFNLSVRNVFNTRKNEQELFSDEAYLYSFGTRGRFVTFGFSYGFGKGEAMEYSGGRRR